MRKDIKGYEGLYQISDEGQVRRIHKDGSTRPVKGKGGSKYYTVDLCKDGKPKCFNVHRLVAEAFLEMPEGCKEVNHKDGNKKNNHVDNLEWVTQKENLLHAIEQLQHYPFGKPARKVNCIDAETGEIIQTFPSLMDAARACGKASARTGITLVCQGLQNKAYGYKWEYVD